MVQAMIDLNKVDNYKKCRKKQYSIHFCIPPKGTIVINKLEQADVVAQLKRQYFTVVELEKMKAEAPQNYQLLQNLAQQGKLYVVSEKTPVVLVGTMGEMWTVKFEKLVKGYTLTNGNAWDSIKPEVVVDWTSITSNPDASVAFACFVPVMQKGQIQTPWGAVLNYNGNFVRHGRGDFIIAQMNADGTPNMQDRYVVNGLVFRETYNNKGFVEVLGNAEYEPITIDKLPSLIIKGTRNGVSNVKELEKMAVLVEKAYAVTKNKLECEIFGSAFVLDAESNQKVLQTKQVRGSLKALENNITKVLVDTKINGSTLDYLVKANNLKCNTVLSYILALRTTLAYIRFVLSSEEVYNNYMLIKKYSCLQEYRKGHSVSWLVTVMPSENAAEFGLLDFIKDAISVKTMNSNVSIKSGTVVKELTLSEFWGGAKNNKTDNIVRVFVTSKLKEMKSEMSNYRITVINQLARLFTWSEIQASILERTEGNAYGLKLVSEGNFNITTYFKVDKEKPNDLIVTAKDKGYKFEKTYHINVMKLVTNLQYWSLLIYTLYWDLCYSLKLTPYRFVTSQKFLRECMKFTQENFVNLPVNTDYVFKENLNLTNVAFSVKKGSFERKDGTDNKEKMTGSVCKYVLQTSKDGRTLAYKAPFVTTVKFIESAKAKQNSSNVIDIDGMFNSGEFKAMNQIEIRNYVGNSVKTDIGLIKDYSPMGIVREIACNFKAVALGVVKNNQDVKEETVENSESFGMKINEFN